MCRVAVPRRKRMLRGVRLRGLLICLTLVTCSGGSNGGQPVGNQPDAGGPLDGGTRHDGGGHVDGAIGCTSCPTSASGAFGDDVVVSLPGINVGSLDVVHAFLSEN